MSRSIARSRRTGGLRAGWLLAGWLASSALAAGAAEAARVVEVRVGRHPDFVRVVFETDAPAAFVVERGGPGESRVRIDAAAAPGAVSVPPDSGAEVVLEPLPGGGTLARIRAAAPVRIESQVLDRPPRIVFDLRPSAGEAAEAIETPPEPALQGATAAEVGPEPQPEPAPESAPMPDPAAPALAAELENPPIFPDLASPLAESPELEPPEPPAQAASEPPPAPSEPTLPPVSAAPPAAIAPRLDERSLLLGAAGGLALGLGVALLARGRRGGPAGPQPLPEIPVETVEEARLEQPSASAAEERAAGPAFEPLAADLLTMIQRLDERCAEAEEALSTLGERTERLERRSGAEAEELAFQRAALTRLDRALGRPLARPEPRPPEPEPASTPPPRPV